MASKFTINPKIEELTESMVTLTETFINQHILEPIRSKGKGRSNYPKFAKNVYFDGTHDIIIEIDLNIVAASIENGRRSGKMPPREKIKEWIKVKRIIPRNNVTIDQLSFLIARKIGKYGTKPKHYLADEINNLRLIDDEYEDLINSYISAFEIID